VLLAKVVGNVISTIKPESHHGNKLMYVELIGLDGKPYGARQIVMDMADAGIGDTVLVNVDGGAALMILGDKKAIVDQVICGVIDHYTVGDEIVPV
jgi:microcompartment protein CcmK/EutM